MFKLIRPKGSNIDEELHTNTVNDHLQTTIRNNDVRDTKKTKEQFTTQQKQAPSIKQIKSEDERATVYENKTSVHANASTI